MANHRWNNFLTRISNWEYWPAWLFNIPVLFMWLAQAVRCRNLFFFSSVNPDIETGGFFSEEKWPIYQMFPDAHIPKGIFIQGKPAKSSINEKLARAKLTYPILAKPNIGERGMGIERLENHHALKKYHQAANFDYILQTFISFPLEMSVLAYRLPDSEEVSVTSVCLKEKLSIKGDGHSTIVQLANEKYRSRKQWKRLGKNFDAHKVLDAGERLVLEPIGNHSRGSTFLDGNNLITAQFTAAVKKLFLAIEGEIYYGRFDIIYQDIASFVQLEQFKVIEFNGVGSEPAHIYQPGFSIIKAYQCLWKHARILGDIAIIQQQKGVKQMTWKEFKKAIKLYRKNLHLVNSSIDN